MENKPRKCKEWKPDGTQCGKPCYGRICRECFCSNKAATVSAIYNRRRHSKNKNVVTK
jgi:hypothetical protein